VEEVADPGLTSDTDAIVRVTHTAICGADLLPYHGYTPGFELGTTLGHEFVGVVEDAGDALGSLRVGERVVNTSMTSDGTCAHCRAGRPTQCVSRAMFGYSGVYPRLEGGQADLVRVPRGDRCLWPIPDDVSDEDAVFIADILPTGFLAVQRAGVGSGDVVVVLGSGPVGLMALICAVGTARRVIAVDGIPARRAVAESAGRCGCRRRSVRGARRGRRDRGVGLTRGSHVGAGSGAPAGHRVGRRGALRARLPARQRPDVREGDHSRLCDRQPGPRPRTAAGDDPGRSAATLRRDQRQIAARRGCAGLPGVRRARGDEGHLDDRQLADARLPSRAYLSLRRGQEAAAERSPLHGLLS
jgi:threonine dehydrogenase-like Zn-dependent dehydrogenase